MAKHEVSEEDILRLLDEGERIALERARGIASWFDDRLKIAGFGIGIDGLVGLIPGVGDAFTAGMGLYLLQLAMRLKLGLSTYLAMILNILIDLLVGAIPILGDLFDFAFRAHRKNMKIIEQKLEHKARKALPK